MTGLSISSAWEEGSRFAAKEFRLLFPIAFLFTVVPQMALSLFIPPEESVEMLNLADYVRQNGIGTIMLIAVAVGLVVFVLQTLGNLAITYLALRPGTSVGEGFGVALRRLPAVLGAIVLIGLATAVLLLPLFLLILPGTAGGFSVAGATGIVLLFFVLIMVGALVLSAKLLPLLPAGVVEPLGPIALIKRSWNLTKGHFWSILGTILLIGLIYSVMIGIISLVIDVLVLFTIGNPSMDRSAMFASDFIVALIVCVATIFLLCFFARIYAHLAGGSAEPRPAIQ